MAGMVKQEFCCPAVYLLTVWFAIELNQGLLLCQARYLLSLCLLNLQYFWLAGRQQLILNIKSCSGLLPSFRAYFIRFNCLLAFTYINVFCN